MFIREHGYRERFQGRWYTKYDVDGWSYWTMGAPIENTILINRRRLENAEGPTPDPGEEVKDGRSDEVVPVATAVATIV